MTERSYLISMCNQISGLKQKSLLVFNHVDGDRTHTIIIYYYNIKWSTTEKYIITESKLHHRRWCPSVFAYCILMRIYYEEFGENIK